MTELRYLIDIDWNYPIFGTAESATDPRSGAHDNRCTGIEPPVLSATGMLARLSDAPRYTDTKEYRVHFPHRF
jgi:hypothetical protein